MQTSVMDTPSGRIARRIPPSRSRRVHRDVVGRVYRDAAGNLPDFTRLDRHAPGWRRWSIAGGLVTLGILAVAAWVGFFVFKPYTTTTTGDVALRIDAPPTVPPGTETTYHVIITNDDRVPIAAASLDVRLPDDFVLIDATPAPDSAATFHWSIGTIAERAERDIAIHGRLFGPPGTTATATASFIYRPGNFNADFQTSARSTIAIGASPLAMTIDGPERAVPGDTVTYTIAYTNIGTLLLPGTQIVVPVPTTFAIRSVSRERLRDDIPTFALGDLTPNTTGTITITGTYSAGTRDPYPIRAIASVASVGDRRIAIEQSELTTHVLGGDVAIIATVNDQAAGIDSHPGDALRFRIAVRNDGEDELRSLTIRAIFEATTVGERSVLSFGAITDPADGTAIGEQLAPGWRRGTLTWTPKEIPGLATLPKGEQRTIDFTLPIQTVDALTNFPSAARSTLVAEVAIAETGEVAQVRSVRSPAMEIRIRRDTGG